MSSSKTIHLTGDHAIPGVLFLKYDLRYRHHWIGSLGDIEIAFNGDEESLQFERITPAQKIIPVLSDMELRARTDVHEHFTRGDDPNDPFNEWTLLTVYFGFDGTEPDDVFSLHFGLGIWDWSTPYYAQYRLNSEHPLQSTLLGFGREDWRLVK